MTTDRETLAALLREYSGATYWWAPAMRKQALDDEGIADLAEWLAERGVTVARTSQQEGTR